MKNKLCISEFIIFYSLSEIFSQICFYTDGFPDLLLLLTCFLHFSLTFSVVYKQFSAQNLQVKCRHYGALHVSSTCILFFE